VTWTSLHNFKAVWIQKDQKSHAAWKINSSKNKMKRSTQAALWYCTTTRSRMFHLEKKSNSYVEF